jgi:hypothetical protein
MKVTFTKTDAARYTVAITRAKGGNPAGTAPTPRPATGYDAHMPPDLARFLIEEQFGIRSGVFGQLATGGDDVSTPYRHRDRSGRSRHAAHRLAAATRSDMARADRLVALCRPLWEARAGRIPTTPAVIDMTLATPFDVDRAVKRLDEVSARWTALRPGESITLDWPADLVIDMAGQSH